MSGTIEQIRELHRSGFELTCWSAGGAQYARDCALELGIEHLFVNFLGKPRYFIDDQRVADWKTSEEIHPSDIHRLLTHG